MMCNELDACDTLFFEVRTKWSIVFVRELKKGKINRIETYIFGLLFIAVWLVLFWKCRYGYAHIDEASYPTIAYRFIQGDSILYDEWNNTQLASLLMLPFLKVYILSKEIWMAYI